MKIAQIAPLYEAVPPRFYGGTERIVAHLTDALVELGHEVTLFASAEAQTRSTLVPVRDQAIRLDPRELKSNLAVHLSMLHEVHKRQHAFDMLHFHVDLIHFPFFEDFAAHTVTTLHGRLDLKDLPEAYARWRAYPLVSISEDQRTPLPDAYWLATIQHGLAPDLYRFTAGAEESYLAFLGRISPEIGDGEKAAFLGNASALLFPIDWPEPFGLVMIEAMACGTPVIAWRCGSVPEIVNEGESGFIVETEDAAVAAVANLHRIDRRAVRDAFERRFTATVMARNYLQLYWRLSGVTGAPLRHRRLGLVH